MLRVGAVIVFPTGIRTKLISAAQSVVDDVCQKQLGRMKRPPRIEVDFVASLIENGASELTNAWQSILSPHIRVSVAGVFCHQSPMVRISDTPTYAVPTQRCELADLLILHSHINPAGKEYWRAVFMQTKVVAGLRTFAPDEPQFWLYDKWPQFSILPPRFDPRARDFNADSRSGQYGLLSNGRWLVAPPANPLSAASTGVLSLAEFLVAMLYDMDPAQTGRTSRFGRQVYQSSQYDWSPTVWELLQTTALKALRHKGKTHGLYAGDMSRMGGHILRLFTDQSRSAFPPDLPAKADSGDDGGVNVLVIQTGRSE
jgi:hypothetical protein